MFKLGTCGLSLTRQQPFDLRLIADQARTIRIPVHMIKNINKINRVSRQLLQEMGRKPTLEELGERLEMDEAKVRNVLKIAKEPISMEKRLVQPFNRINMLSLLMDS